jgi:hypothetical protein
MTRGAGRRAPRRRLNHSASGRRPVGTKPRSSPRPRDGDGPRVFRQAGARPLTVDHPRLSVRLEHCAPSRTHRLPPCRGPRSVPGGALLHSLHTVRYPSPTGDHRTSGERTRLHRTANWMPRRHYFALRPTPRCWLRPFRPGRWATATLSAPPWTDGWCSGTAWQGGFRRLGEKRTLAGRSDRRRGPAATKSAVSNPGGYCGLGGTGVSCPVGLAASG